MKRLQEIIDGAKRVVFFGGAGVSTEYASLVLTKKEVAKAASFFSASLDAIELAGNNRSNELPEVSLHPCTL